MKKKTTYYLLTRLVVILLLLSQHLYYSASFLDYSNYTQVNVIVNSVAFDFSDSIDAEDCEIEDQIFPNKTILLSTINLWETRPNYIMNTVIHHPYDVFTPPPQIDLRLS